MSELSFTLNQLLLYVFVWTMVLLAIILQNVDRVNNEKRIDEQEQANKLLTYTQRIVALTTSCVLKTQYQGPDDTLSKEIHEEMKRFLDK